MPLRVEKRVKARGLSAPVWLQKKVKPTQDASARDADLVTAGRRSPPMKGRPWATKIQRFKGDYKVTIR